MVIKIWFVVILMLGLVPLRAQFLDNSRTIKANGIKYVEAYLVNSESPKDTNLFYRSYFNDFGKQEKVEHYDSSEIITLTTYEYILDTLESIRIIRFKNGQISTKRSTYNANFRLIRIAYFNDSDTEPNWYTTYKYKRGKKVERIYRTGNYKSFEKIKYDRTNKKTYHIRKYTSRGKKKKKVIPIDKNNVKDREQIFENYQNSGLKLVRTINKNLSSDQVVDYSEVLKIRNNELLITNFFYDRRGLLVKGLGYYKNMDSWVMVKYYYFNSDNSDEE